MTLPQILSCSLVAAMMAAFVWGRLRYDVVGVFCQPDRPKGRGHKLAACPVKETALAAGIPVFQPERIKREEGVKALRGLAPDLCVTAAFGPSLLRCRN